jgi:hypothetical protein
MITLRLFILLFLLCSIAYAPLIVTLTLAVFYCLYFRAYEIIVIGFFVDAFYGTGVGIPYYLLGGTVLFIASEWIKPRLLMYNR